VQHDLKGLFERALHDEPEPPPGDPAGPAMAQGRRIRRRRNVLVGGSATAAVVAVLTLLNVALAPAAPPPPVPAEAAMPALVTTPCAEPLKKADQVAIFLADEITSSQRFNLDAALRADPIVRNLQFESRQQAYARFVKLWKDNPEFVRQVSPRALPEAFRLDLAEPAGYPGFAAKLRKQAGVQDVVGQPCSGAGR
jgi:hypothetical protein